VVVFFTSANACTHEKNGIVNSRYIFPIKKCIFNKTC